MPNGCCESNMINSFYDASSNTFKLRWHRGPKTCAHRNFEGCENKCVLLILDILHPVPLKVIAGLLIELRESPSAQFQIRLFIRTMGRNNEVGFAERLCDLLLDPGNVNVLDLYDVASNVTLEAKRRIATTLFMARIVVRVNDTLEMPWKYDRNRIRALIQCVHVFNQARRLGDKVSIARLPVELIKAVLTPLLIS